jgi:putative transposase
MTTNTPNDQRHRVSSELINYAIWLSRRLWLSFREVEELLGERGVTVTDETVRRWCQKCGPAYVHKGWCSCSTNPFR